MNATLLIHAIVRQTMVLIASLATAAGQRAQLAALANQVFANLVRELREQGLGSKVIADMFGLALRTYHRKVARLGTSQSEGGRSLWEAVFSHIQQHSPLLRSELLQRFARDDEASLQAVLFDLVESGLVVCEGQDAATVLRLSEGLPEDPRSAQGALEALVLVTVHRAGRIDLATLAGLVPATPEQLTAALTHLCSQGVMAEREGSEPVQYVCERYLIPFGDAIGWEAAVFDHYQAMVSAIVSKLRVGKRRAELDDCVGGSTFVFDLWHGHPMQAEILGYLKSMREHGMKLRRELEQFNASTDAPQAARALRVTAYVGQGVTDEEGNSDA
jgi:hypothetical protein